MPSLVAAFASNTMLVGLAARLPAEKMIRAVVAANLNKFISSSLQFSVGVNTDDVSRNRSVPVAPIIEAMGDKRELLNCNFLGILVTV